MDEIKAYLQARLAALDPRLAVADCEIEMIEKERELVIGLIAELESRQPQT